MKKAALLIVLLAAVSITGCGNNGAGDEKVINLYAPAEVAYGTVAEIKGKLIYKQYNQPAQGVDPSSVQKAYYFALVPDTPFNAVPSKQYGGQPQYNVAIIQVEDSHSFTLSRFKDKKVRIKGVLHEGIPRVHYTRVVITPSDITVL